MLTFPLLCYFVTDQESPLYNNGRLYLLIVAEVQIRSNVHFSPVCSSVQCNEVQIRFPLLSSVLHCTMQQYILQCNAMNSRYSLMKTSCTTNVALCFYPVHCKLCCSAVQCCTLKNAPICTELLFSDCPFQCSPLCVRRHLPVLNRWKVGFDRNRGRNPKSFQNRRQHLIAVSSVFVRDSLSGEKYSCSGL